MNGTARALGYLYYWPKGVDSKSTRAQLSVSLFRPRELLATYPMGFSLRKLQTSISPEPLIVQRADFAWKFIWARGIG